MFDYFAFPVSAVAESAVFALYYIVEIRELKTVGSLWFLTDFPHYFFPSKAVALRVYVLLMGDCVTYFVLEDVLDFFGVFLEKICADNYFFASCLFSVFSCLSFHIAEFEGWCCFEVFLDVVVLLYNLIVEFFRLFLVVWFVGLFLNLYHLYLNYS